MLVWHIIGLMMMLLKQRLYSVVALVVGVSFCSTNNAAAAVMSHDDIVIDPLLEVIESFNDAQQQQHEAKHEKESDRRFLDASSEGINATAFVGEFCTGFNQVFQASGFDVTCNCTTSFELICERPVACTSPVASCDDEPVCTTSIFFIFFTEGATRIRSIGGSVDFVPGGPSAYNRTRLLVEQPKLSEPPTCRSFYVLNDLEYECKACEVCGGNIGAGALDLSKGIRTDCTNIQPQAAAKDACDSGIVTVAKTSTVIADDEDANATTSSDFQLCFLDNETSVPTPTTRGTTPVEIALSGAASTMGNFVLGISIVMGVIGWMF